jgi:hypothetical protein
VPVAAENCLAALDAANLITSATLVSSFVVFLVQFHKWLFLLFAMTTLLKSSLRNQCQALHTQWLLSLKEPKAVTHPDSRTMLIRNLRDLHSHAMTIFNRYEEPLDTISSSLVQHITSRSLNSHIAIEKNTENLIKGF